MVTLFSIVRIQDVDRREGGIKTKAVSCTKEEQTMRMNSCVANKQQQQQQQQHIYTTHKTESTTTIRKQ